MNTDIINLLSHTLEYGIELGIDMHMLQLAPLWYVILEIIFFYVDTLNSLYNSKISGLCHTDLLLFSNSCKEQKENTSYAMPMIVKIMEILAVYKRTISSY